MTDIHAHILPGIDDGAEDMYDTLEMIHMAVTSGVRAIVATPHCNLPGLYNNYFGKAYIDNYESVVRAVKEERIPVKVLPGMEAYATEKLPDLIVDGKIMPLNQSRYILMEFAFDEDPEFADYLLEKVSEVGAKPVIAHAERYEFVWDDPGIVYEWRKKGYIIQVNKCSVLGRFGQSVQRAAYQLLRHNLVSVIASDAHSPFHRTPHMSEAFEQLRMEFSKRQIQVWFSENPQRICGNRPILKLEPIPFTEHYPVYEGEYI